MKQKRKRGDWELTYFSKQLLIFILAHILYFMVLPDTAIVFLVVSALLGFVWLFILGATFEDVPDETLWDQFLSTSFSMFPLFFALAFFLYLLPKDLFVTRVK